MSETAQPVHETNVIPDPWGARARDWADIEDENSRPLFESLFQATGVGAGTKLLDVGCGSGLACAIAAGRGAQVTGLDASPGLLAIARERVPEGDFRLGDMVSLPFPGDTFDVVTFFNTFFFAEDQAAALREAGRVGRAGAQIAVVVWKTPQETELTAYVAALEPLLPPEMPQINPFVAPAELEALARRAGVDPERSLDLDWSWEYPDLETALRGLLSPGLSTVAIAASGKKAVEESLTRALEPLRLSSGGYRIENAVHCLIARA